MAKVSAEHLVLENSVGSPFKPRDSGVKLLMNSQASNEDKTSAQFGDGKSQDETS